MQRRTDQRASYDARVFPVGRYECGECRRIEFLVDTGASHIALRESEAGRLGIYPRASDFTVRVSTANGMTKAALVELRTVEVGDIVVRNVPAIIHSNDGLSVNLLGMSFLSRVRWTHERGKLVLEQ